MADTSSAADRHAAGLPAASRAWKTACRRWVLPTPEGPYRKRGAGSRAARRVCAAARRAPGGEVPLADPAPDRLADPGPDRGRVLSLSRPRWLAHGSPASSTPVETRLTGPCAQALLRAAVPVTTPSRPACRPSPWMAGVTREDSMNDVIRRRVRPADQTSIERAPSDGKKKN